MADTNGTPNGITARKRINISRTSTGNYSYETTCEIVNLVTWDAVLAIINHPEVKSDGSYMELRLADLGRLAQAEIAERKAREAVG